MILFNTIGRPVEWLRERVAHGLTRLHVTPNVLTLFGLCVSAAAGAAFALGHFRWAVAAIILSSAFDMLDGSVARITRKASRFGALLDSTIDRYNDAVICAGIIVHYLLARETRPVMLTTSVLVGSLLISYARARAESLIESCKVGFFERGERLVTLMIGALFHNMSASLWILAVLTHWTVLVRVHHTWRTLSGRPAPAANTLTGQLYHLLFWDFNRGSIQFDIMALATALSSAFLRL
jgi:CDP-diacylglycerol--glycerol-3-phosphate 3-phosphatidyltransferase